MLCVNTLRLYHSRIVEGMKDSWVNESLQKGYIISFPLRKGQTAVLWIVGGIKLQRQAGALLC